MKLNKIKNISMHQLFFGIVTLCLAVMMAYSPSVHAAHCATIAGADAQERCAQAEQGGQPTNLAPSEGKDTADETAFKFNNKDSDVGINDLVIEILRFLSIAVGIAVVAGISVGGITYSLGRGNPGQVQKGVTIITNSIIGLVLYFLLFAIVNFLVPGGVLR